MADSNEITYLGKEGTKVLATKIKNKVLDFIFIILTIVGVGIAALGLFKLVN